MPSILFFCNSDSLSSFQIPTPSADSREPVGVEVAGVGCFVELGLGLGRTRSRILAVRTVSGATTTKTSDFPVLVGSGQVHFGADSHGMLLTSTLAEMDTHGTESPRYPELLVLVFIQITSIRAEKFLFHAS